ASAESIESRTPRTHLRKHEKPDGIQPGRGHRTSHTNSCNTRRALARASECLGTLQRRRRYLERVRHIGPPDLRGAHRLDASSADHAGTWRGKAIRSL